MQRVEFESLKSETSKVPTLSNPFDIMKPFERTKKNIEITFSESKEKLYNVANVRKAADGGQDINRRRLIVSTPTPPSAVTYDSSTVLQMDKGRKKNSLVKSNSFNGSNGSNNQQVMSSSVRIKDKLRRQTKPNIAADTFSETTSVPSLTDLNDNNNFSNQKISLPKLNKYKSNLPSKEKLLLNQQQSEQVVKLENSQVSGMVMFNLDSDKYSHNSSKPKNKSGSNEKVTSKKLTATKIFTSLSSTNKMSIFFKGISSSEGNC